MLIRRVPANTVRDGVLIPRQKRFTTRRASFPHAAWLGQGYPHCPIFLTAASRRSLDRSQFQCGGPILSEPLPIVDLVGRYPTNYLMGRVPILYRIAALDAPRCRNASLWNISTSFPMFCSCTGQVAHVLRTRTPLVWSCVATRPLPFDLHVLSLPPAFILSQDQTLHCIYFSIFFFVCPGPL